jgi:hypothetical protein
MSTAARYGGNVIGADRSRCRTCGAAIRWAPSARTGKPMPLDAQPTSAGTFVITATGHAAYSPGTPEPRYRSHFSTCPDANKHRRTQ